MRRKNPLVNGEIYHIFSRSIANFKIFNDDKDYQRLLYLMKYFQIKEPPIKFSYFMVLKGVQQYGFFNYFNKISKDQEKRVQIIAYCLMPTHIHLILKQLTETGISIFMGNILNSYSRYFNTKHHRKGPLWEGKFENVIVESDEQLIHLARYNHLNPTTAQLVKKPEDWIYSSYREYIDIPNVNVKFCQFDDILDIDPQTYKRFVNDQISYQRDLAKIKNLMLDEYTT